MSRDRGSATAELAVALPAVMILLLAGLAAIATVAAQLGCLSTARETALALSRGESVSNMDGTTVMRAADIVRVTVARGVVTCEAVAALEPGEL